MENKTEISDKTMIKIPLPLAVTIIIGIFPIFGAYYKSQTTSDKVITVEETVKNNETLNRKEREEIKDEFEEDDEKMEARLMDFMKAEIDGLRADWERDRLEQNRRIENLEK